MVEYTGGIMTPTITPMNDLAKVEYRKIYSVIDHPTRRGIKAIASPTTTGESDYLSECEMRRIITETSNVVRELRKGGRDIYFVAGAGRENPKKARRIAEHAASEGADAVMAKIPDGCPSVVGYYREIDRAGLPFFAYFSPVLGGDEPQPLEILGIAAMPHCSGFKYGARNAEELSKFRKMLSEEGFQEKMVLIGNDRLILDGAAMGCHGAVSSLSGFAPLSARFVYEAGRKNEVGDSRAIECQRKLAGILDFIRKHGNDMVLSHKTGLYFFTGGKTYFGPVRQDKNMEIADPDGYTDALWELAEMEISLAQEGF